MPVKIPSNLPASSILQSENIFVMDEDRAATQDIRPLRILILNLMPTKIVTETQLLRVIGNTPLQIEPTLLITASHRPKHVSKEHLDEFYHTFDEIKDKKYDGMIITGAPVEKMDFEEVHYWNELESIMAWAKTHVFSTMYICWAAQAGLYYHYGIEKHILESKLSGVFKHRVLCPHSPLVRGFDDEFYAPHSRYTDIDTEAVKSCEKLELLTYSKEAGCHIVASKNGKHVFVTGHSEYDQDTIKKEYERDVARGLEPELPSNYFPDDNPAGLPVVTWRAHANLLFSNWLNYCVYQTTPYDIDSAALENQS